MHVEWIAPFMSRGRRRGGPRFSFLGQKLQTRRSCSAPRAVRVRIVRMTSPPLWMERFRM
jgi:hypothetical protein